MEKEEGQKKRKLTLKQRKWLACYMETGNATQCALEAYELDKETQYDAASQIGWENIRKLEIEIEDLMDEAGLSDVYLIKKLDENLNATKLFGKEAIEHDDFASRNKALEIALKLRGNLTEKLDLTSKGEKLKSSVIVQLPSNGREKDT